MPVSHKHPELNIELQIINPIPETLNHIVQDIKKEEILKSFLPKLNNEPLTGKVSVTLEIY